jgi:hypothetical protein
MSEQATGEQVAEVLKHTRPLGVTTASKTAANPKAKPDWQAIRREYEEGSDEVTLPVLAAKHGLSLSGVQKRSAAEGWTTGREAFRQLSGGIERQKRAEALAEQQAQESVARHGAMHALVMEGVERVRAAEDGPQYQAAATAFGILVDKLHKELDRSAPKGNSNAEAPDGPWGEHRTFLMSLREMTRSDE